MYDRKVVSTPWSLVLADHLDVLLEARAQRVPDARLDAQQDAVRLRGAAPASAATRSERRSDER